ncbi:MAG: protein-methionine-sulfoxide reductase catalytic subunit MsrP [bacterium]
MNFIKKPGWAIPEREATPESLFMGRRNFLKGTLGALATSGIGTLAAGALGQMEIAEGAEKDAPKDKTLDLYPAKRNPAFKLDRPLTEERVAATYNNFYEFSGTKAVYWLSKRMETRPWQVSVEGLVKKPKVYDIDDLIRSMPLEERLLRFRCVEAWAMAVPWTGFPISALIKAVEPKSTAKYVKFKTFYNPKVALGQLRVWYAWPYIEVLTMEEAMNSMAMLVTGIYGKPLPQQHGAPLRLITPWKYGFKSIKSIVEIEFRDDRPKTFWERAAPREYGFWANVNPAFNHPRWSQKTERMLGLGDPSTWKRRPTQIFNGYGEWVASMYPDLKNRKFFM